MALRWGSMHFLLGWYVRRSVVTGALVGLEMAVYFGMMGLLVVWVFRDQFRGRSHSPSVHR